MSYVTVLKLFKQGPFHLACGLFLLAMVPLGYAQQQSALKVSLSLPQATMDVAYSGSMNITGGAGPYSITESGTLPAGLAWHDGANGSLLTGTPTASGTFNLTVIVTDTIGEKFVQTGALVVGTVRPRPLDSAATQSVTDVIVIVDSATANAAPTVTPSTIPSGKAGTPYGPVFFTNLDTTTPVVFNLLGALPQGMVATPGTNTLELSGTPLVSGSFPIQVQIFNLPPYAIHTTSTNYTLSIAAPQPLQIVVSSSFNDAPYVGTAIVPATFTAGGGSGNLSTSVSGALPGGLTLTPGTDVVGIPDLVLSGTPTVEGQEEFTIKVTDNVLGTTFSQKYAINAREPVRYADPSDAPSGTVGQFYYFIASVAGTPPPNYTVKIAGPLPPGLTLAYSGSSAILSGTPTLAGSYLMVPEGTDQYGNTDIIGLYTVVIKPAPFVTIAATSTPIAPTYNDADTVSFALTGSLPAVPTGSLSIALDGGTAKTYPITAGAVTLPLGRQAAGSHTLTYSYSGDATYPALTGQTYGFIIAVPPYSVVGSQTDYHQAYTQYGNVAVDSKDNVYYVDYTCACIYKIDTQGNQTVFPSTGLYDTQGLRFDAADNLYLADTGNSRVLMITQAGVQTVLPINGLASPQYLAFDAGYQNLYVMDDGIFVYNLASQTTVYKGDIPSRHGVAVDAQNNVYYVSGKTILKNGAVIATLPTQPYGLNFDHAGNLYIGGNNALYRMDPTGNVTQMSDVSTNEVAVDSHGTLYYPVGADMLAYYPGPAVWGGRNEAYNNGRPPYQTTTNYFRAFYLTPAGVTLSSVAIPSVGSPYTGDTAPNCFTSTLCGATLSLGAFLPGPQPGYGVARFSDGTKTVTPLYGSGVQIAIGFTPGNTTGIASGIANFGGAANDLNGGVYVSDSVANQVFKVSGGTLTPMAFTGLNAPTQLATDGTGSVYVLDSGTQRILKLDSGGNQTVAFDMSQQGSLLPSTLASLQSFAVDGATNLYLGGASSSGAALIEFFGVNGASSIYATPPAVPATLALDTFGTLYSADVQGALAKYDHFANRVPVATGLPVSNSMAIEPSGTVYLGSNTSPMLTQVSPTGTVAPYQVPGVNLASVVTIDNYGSLSVGDNSTQILTFNDRTTQPYAFGDVALGATSTLHHSVVNVGSQGGMTMSFSGDSFFDVDPTTTTCVMNSTALDPGQSCEIGITYSARYRGPFTGTGAVHATSSQLFSESTSSRLTMTGTGATSVPVANPGGPYTGTVVSAVSFTGLASTDSTGEALTYNWDFGDGNSGTGATIAHTYAAAKTYIVKLTVANTDGVTAFATTTATIGQSYTASLTPASYDFGYVPVAAHLPHAFTLLNSSAAAMAITSISLAADPNNSFSSSNNCGTSLAASASCTIMVTYTPTATGPSGTVLSVQDAAGTQTSTISGTSSPTIGISATSFDFGNVYAGSTATGVLRLTNSTSRDLVFNSDSSSNPLFGLTAATTGSCVFTIPANSSCTVGISFSPATAAAASGNIVIITDGGNQDFNIKVTGTGISPLSLNPTGVDFGNVLAGSTATSAVSITNNSATDVVFNSVQSSNRDFGYSLTAPTSCIFSIPAHSVCTVTLTFSPPVEASENANILITAWNGNQDFSIHVAGTGTPPLSISATSYNFGSVVVGSTANSVLTLMNPTPTDVTLNSLSSTNSAFAITNGTTNGCVYTIPANSSCTINISFTPSVTGAAAANDVIVTGNGGQDFSIAVTGVGTAANGVKSTLIIIGTNVTTMPTDGSSPATSSTGGGIGAAVDAQGNILSIDTAGGSLTKFTDVGVAVGSLTGNGLTNATALAIDGLSNLYVVNGNGTISVFDSSGNAVGTTTIGASSTVTKPASINVDASGSLWIANAGNNTVTEFIGAGAPAQPLVNAVVNATPGTRP